jgi:D-arabinose 1-dehydrogenase-like Zn-dependent alcohol dehydrogenase
MKAAVVHRFDKPLSIEDVPIPSPGAEPVLVRISGRETLCHDQLNTGYSINGGFAEFAVGYARHVVKVPTASIRSTPRR